ncbi:hypothetical protein J6590_089493, partial [Homalodisca vitripennis]
MAALYRARIHLQPSSRNLVVNITDIQTTGTTTENPEWHLTWQSRSRPRQPSKELRG